MFPKIRTLPCPNCNEMINTNMRFCRYCSSPIDPQAAEAAANVQEKVNHACSDANYLNMVAGINIVCVLFGRLFLFASFPILTYMLFRWRVKYGRLKTLDPDYERAKKQWYLSLASWVVLPVLLLVVSLIGSAKV